MPIRRLRNYFFGPQGMLYSKFSRNNIPTETMYRELMNASPFIAEASDTAKTTEAGHVKLSTDDHAIAKNDNGSDGHVRTVLPHQLPGVAISDGTEGSVGVDQDKDGIRVTGAEKSLGGSLKRLIYKIRVLVAKSLVINGDEEIELDGDEASPTDGKFYGKLNGAKGWYDPISDPSAVPYTGVDSVEVDNTTKEITLDGDETTPTNGKFYGISGGNKGWYFPTSEFKVMFDNEYTEYTMAASTLDALGTLSFIPTTHLANTGGKLITRFCVKRIAAVAQRRALALRIGTNLLGGPNNAQLLFDQYANSELTEETYLITAEITYTAASTYHVFATIETMSAIPTQKEMKTNVAINVTLPASSYITLFGQCDTATSAFVFQWADGYYFQI